MHTNMKKRKKIKKQINNTKLYKTIYSTYRCFKQYHENIYICVHNSHI